MGFAPKRIARSLLAVDQRQPTNDQITDAIVADTVTNDYDVDGTDQFRIVRVREILERLVYEEEELKRRHSEPMLGEPELHCYASGSGALSFVYQQQRKSDQQWIAVGSPGEYDIDICREFLHSEKPHMAAYDIYIVNGQVTAVHHVERVDDNHLKTIYPGMMEDQWRADVNKLKTTLGYAEWRKKQVETFRYEPEGSFDYMFYFIPSKRGRAVLGVAEQMVVNLSLRAVLRFYLQNEEQLLRLRGEEVACV